MTLKLAQYGPADPSVLPTPPAPRGAVWLTVEEAARRAGQSPGHIRRRCAEVWMTAGLARVERPEGGGKPRWVVRDDASPELARVKGPDQIGTDLSHLTDAQRRQVAERKAILSEWEQACSARIALGISKRTATDQYLLVRQSRGLPAPSRATLFNWARAYRAGGLAALVDGRAVTAGGDGGSELTLELVERVKALYLTPRAWSLRRCYDLAMSELMSRGRIQAFEDVPAGSYRSVSRCIERLPKAVVTLKRKGAKAYTDKHEPYITRDYSALESNSVWCGDHHRFDVIVQTGTKADGSPQFGRPWLTAWQDLRSRKIVGYHIAATDPNTDTILLAFRSAAAEFGLPGEVMIDNGRDYDSRQLQGMTKKQRQQGGVATADARLAGVFPILGVAVRHVQPYHGQSKPIERFFGTLADRFSRLFETYCGHKTDAKPEDLQDRLAGGNAPTLEEFARDFDDWLRYEYHLAEHRGDAMDGRCPDEVYAACLGTKRAATAEQLRCACMPRFGPVRVGQHGVTYRGMHFGGFSAEVAGLFGRRVMIAVDLNDLSYVMLVSEDGRLLCRADANERLHVQANGQDVRAALADKRKTRRVVSEYAGRRTRIAEDTRDAVLRAARERSASTASAPTDVPPSIAPVRTPFDESLRELSKLRPAAGEEHLGRDLGAVRFGLGAQADDEVSVPSFRELAARRRAVRGDGTGETEDADGGSGHG